MPVVLLLGLWPGIARLAALELAVVFKDHMVLQRDQAVPIWGRTQPGETITVRFGAQEIQAQADAKGAWRADLAPLPMSKEPQTMRISSPSQTVELRDILVGEVWLGAGQSNMDTPILFYSHLIDKAKALANQPQIRYFGLPGLGYGVNGLPAHQRVSEDVWTVLTPDSVLSCSAMQFFFALRLREALDVPIGILCRGVGSSQTGVWVRNEALADEPACVTVMQKFSVLARQEALAKHRKEVATVRYYNAHRPPGVPERAMPGAPDEIPAPRPGASGKLYQTRIVPVQPYAVRGICWDQGDGGVGNLGTGIHGMHMLAIMPALVRSWRADWGRSAKDLPFFIIQKPSGMGWSGTFRPSGVDSILPTLEGPAVADTGWAQNWQYWMMVQRMENAFMVSSMGLVADIHPGDKDAYGRRLADSVLARVYSISAPHQTPMFESCTVQGNTMRLRLSETGTGLQALGVKELHGLTLAGAEQLFFPAEGRIVSPTEIEVRSSQVPRPVAVSYPGGNIGSSDGFQAYPFRGGQEGPVDRQRAEEVLIPLLQRSGQAVLAPVSMLLRLELRPKEVAAAVRRELQASFTAGGPPFGWMLHGVDSLLGALHQDPELPRIVSSMLLEVLKHPRANANHQRHALERLGRMGLFGIEALEELRTLSKTLAPEVRTAASSAITAIEGAYAQPAATKP